MQQLLVLHILFKVLDILQVPRIYIWRCSHAFGTFRKIMQPPDVFNRHNTQKLKNIKCRIFYTLYHRHLEYIYLISNIQLLSHA
jgi:hypothetical protein